MVVVLSSSGGVGSNSVEARGTVEVVPCSQNQMGTFLERITDGKERDRAARSEEVTDRRQIVLQQRHKN